MRVLVVANRTAATPWLLGEVERRVQAGPCEVALLVPPVGGRGAVDWTPEDAARLLERAVGAPVERIPAGRDAFAAIAAAVRDTGFDEILVSTAPTRRPRRDLVRRLDALDVPVTTLGPREKPADQSVIKVRWTD
jgi:hypothetical protein